MSSQLLTSVMEGSYNFARDLMKLSQCNKRKQKPTPPQIKLSSWGKVGVSRKKKETRWDSAPKRFDSDDTVASTEPGETSNNEFSDKSDQTDASTMRSGHQAMRAPKMSARQLNAMICPPPGLNAPPGLEPPTSVPSWQRPETRLNAQAACFVPPSAKFGSSLNPDTPCFVPSLGAVASTVDQCLSQSFSQEIPQESQQLRQSIKMLKGALEEWEENNLPAPGLPAAQHHVNASPGPSNNLAVLKEALTKLTPEQASMVKIFLDKKVAPNSTSALSKDTFQQRAQNGPFVPTARPFAPYGGYERKWENVRQPKVPQRTGLKGVSQSAGFDESLKDHLRDLAELDQARVLMVRRINRLGLESPPLLKEYFARFGNVERVMVAHTRCKAKGLENGRVRPAPLGFVIMSKPEEAHAALAHGAEHSLQGVGITVSSFESHPIEESANE